MDDEIELFDIEDIDLMFELSDDDLSLIDFDFELIDIEKDIEQSLKEIGILRAD